MENKIFHLVFEERYIQGGYQALFDSLINTINRYASLKDVKSFYIGKGSGPNGLFAVDRRYDKVKQSYGINYIVAIDKSQSEKFVIKLEKKLLARYLDIHPKCLNDGLGGEGRPSKQYWHFVYLAMHRWGGSKSWRV